MAQSRCSRAHVFGRAAALIRLAPARAGKARAPSSHPTTPAAGGIPFSHLCQPVRAAAAVEVSALACLMGGEAAPARPAVARAGPGGKAM
jgi:hypothetical protein